MIFGNICAVSPNDFPPSRDGTDLYIRVMLKGGRDDFVVMGRPINGFPDGGISLSDPQRKWYAVGGEDAGFCQQELTVDIPGAILASWTS